MIISFQNYAKINLPYRHILSIIKRAAHIFVFLLLIIPANGIYADPPPGNTTPCNCCGTLISQPGNCSDCFPCLYCGDCKKNSPQCNSGCPCGGIVCSFYNVCGDCYHCRTCVGCTCFCTCCGEYLQGGGGECTVCSSKCTSGSCNGCMLQSCANKCPCSGSCTICSYENCNFCINCAAHSHYIQCSCCGEPTTTTTCEDCQQAPCEECNGCRKDGCGNACPCNPSCNANNICVCEHCTACGVCECPTVTEVKLVSGSPSVVLIGGDPDIHLTATLSGSKPSGGQIIWQRKKDAGNYATISSETDVNITLEATDPEGAGKYKYRAKFATGDDTYNESCDLWIIEDFDMDIDADYDGDIDDDDEGKEESDGGIISVNQDDDNNNKSPDKNESGSVSGENDLEKIELLIDPMPNAGNIVLEAISGGSKIKIWENANKGTQITLPKTWALNNDTIPSTIYVEGFAGSSSQRDVELQLRYGNSTTLNDNIKLTIIKVDIDKIAFNYDPASHTHDGLNIRENYTTEISIPEYVKNGQNKPVAYIKNKSIKMLVRIKIEPSLFSSIKIKGISDDSDGSLDDVTEKVVSFNNNGVSQEGTDNTSTSGIDESEYVEFSAGNTPNKVFISKDNWKWVVTKLEDTTIPDMEVDKTIDHQIYTVFTEPQSPWLTSNEENKNPWINVLEYACTWAKNATDESSAVGPITSKAYTDFGREYDGYQTHTPGSHCDLTGLILEPDKWVDCRDMSAVVELFTKVLGGSSVNVLRIYYINCKPIWPIGKPKTPNINWAYHQFGWYDNKVYDACIKIKESAPYIPIADDRDGNYKSNLRLSGGWDVQPPQSITSFE